jgi:hypothetical protein
MKTAVAYITDTLLSPDKGAIGKDSQKEAIRKFAATNGIEIVAWHEDDMTTDEVLDRPGVLEMLSKKHGADLVIVERVWSLSRNWSVLSRLYAEMDKRGMKLAAATTLWDGVSQMTRHHFEPELSTPVAMQRRKAARGTEETVVVRKPEKFPATSPAHPYKTL